ncbi:hypothetical protein NMY22_g13370 [Coprinellus aureogranulatus]|nr:hypothetical protein NMY22_g13370 [Coprinellus aureogranulatus]
MNNAALTEHNIKTAERLQIRNYTTVAFFVVLILEHLQTLDLEVRYVWPTKLNLVKVLFFGARYLGFVNIPLLLRVEFGKPMSPEKCKAMYSAVLLLMGVSTTCSDAIAYIRVYALANRSRAMTIFLPTYFVIVYLAFYIIFIIDIKNKNFSQSHFPLYPCVLVSGDRLQMFIPFVILLVSMMSVCFLGFAFAMRNFYHSKSPLMRIFYIDGTLTFVLMAGVTVAKVVVHLAGPVSKNSLFVVTACASDELLFFLQPEYLVLLTAAHQAVHSTLSARMLLRMRAKAHKGEDSTIFGGGQRTAILFAQALDTLDRQLQDPATFGESPTELTGLSYGSWRRASV